MKESKNCKICVYNTINFCEAYKMSTKSFFITVRVENCEQFREQSTMIKKYQDINQNNFKKGLIVISDRDLLIDYCHIAHLGHLIATIDNCCNEKNSIKYEFGESSLRLRNGATLILK